MTVETKKQELRRCLFDARKSLSQDDKMRANSAIQRQLSQLIADLSPTTVAAYMPLASEPGGTDLAFFLHRLGMRVLLPISNPDRSLNWIELTDDTQFSQGVFGIKEPIGPLLPPSELGTADLIVVPALAVNRAGIRLGKGGGYYDRALAEHQHTTTVTIVFEHELLDEIPTQPHDQPTKFVISPGGLFKTQGNL